MRLEGDEDLTLDGICEKRKDGNWRTTECRGIDAHCTTYNPKKCKANQCNALAKWNLQLECYHRRRTVWHNKRPDLLVRVYSQAISIPMFTFYDTDKDRMTIEIFWLNSFPDNGRSSMNLCSSPFLTSSQKLKKTGGSFKAEWFRPKHWVSKKLHRSLQVLPDEDSCSV